MATQKKMAALSFRLPSKSAKEIRKLPEYTRWIQAMILKNLGLCPYCSQKLKHEPQ
jgi:hypothetical protein